jgi:fructosamine-3-kinase
VKPALQDDLAAAIGAATELPFKVVRLDGAGGGCINRAIVLSGSDGRRFFVKTNHRTRLEMFAAEAAGLTELAREDGPRVPRPIAHGVSGDDAYLVLEWLDLGERGDAAELGRRLAALHRHVADAFGWWRNNTIGATHQDNTRSTDWVTFLRDRRLGFQLSLAEHNGAPTALISRVERLLSCLGVFFTDYQPAASLLHGDLWGGNYSYAAGMPVLFDPAVYYGDREADLAMTELFGGFPDAFHAAYRAAWPLDAGYATRRTLYNLYHVLNHFNLFGGGYAAQARHMTEALLAEAGT